MHSSAEALLAAAVGEWQQHFAAVLQGSPDWEVRGALGNRMLFVLRELLQLFPTWDNVRADVNRFLEAAHQASQASVSMIAGDLSPSCPAITSTSSGICLLLLQIYLGQTLTLHYIEAPHVTGPEMKVILLLLYGL